MRILIWCPEFFPKIGGMQVRADILAKEFLKLGHEVKLITPTAEPDDGDHPYEILREPTRGDLWRLVKWCDVFYHAHFALRPLWPMLLMPRRWVAGVHVSTREPNGDISFFKRIKLELLRFARVITPSRAIANELPVQATVIPNPFPKDIISADDEIERNIDILYVGRLEERKGVHVLLDALAELKTHSLEPKVAIVGSGPSEQDLKDQAEKLDLSAQIDFAGPKFGGDLNRYYNRATILAVPSIWAEAFGIVSLEGISCGCVVVGSHSGGLVEAIGPCGMTFETGNASQMAECLKTLLTSPEARQKYLSHAPSHLQEHSPAVVAQRYLKLFSK